ncbi:MAG: phosphoribosylamine--glycine ligase [Deltaproteobacteria bacterium]
MKVMVVGGGGREHALAWKLAADPRVERVFAAPGSAAIARVAECLEVGAEDIEGLASVAAERGIALTVVGPEVPLALGIVDVFRARGLRIFGPDREGARLESSKAFMKEILVEAGVPTAAYGEFSDVDAACSKARQLGFPVVVKADGLAAGKGVVICADQAEADEAIIAMLEGGRFGQAGQRIVVEEFLVGEEASIMALSDGRHVLMLASSQDHKALLDGDRGPNTGGMGAYCPAPVVGEELMAEIAETVIRPTIEVLASRGIDYRGVLYAGIMITADGPKVLEYNVRFGDPECQPIMVRLASSFLDLIEAAIDGTLDQVEAVWNTGTSVCVVMASGGYPSSYDKGHVMEGLAEAEAMDGVEVFHAGTVCNGDGRWLTNGGRVVGVTASGADVKTATALAYQAVSKISWKDVHYRRDIAHRAIERAANGE